jgi:nucleotide-binding universal stress UspA family protein
MAGAPAHAVPRRRTLKRPAVTAPPGGILLATEGRPISKAAVARAAELAKAERAPVHVFAVARIHGVAFGLPSPWLRPSHTEWQAQRDIVEAAIKQLEQRGVLADGNILGTRKATKRIVGEAERLGCTAIVMTGDPPRSRLVADLFWSQEPYRVKRKASLPVHVVV